MWFAQVQNRVVRLTIATLLAGVAAGCTGPSPLGQAPAAGAVGSNSASRRSVLSQTQLNALADSPGETLLELLARHRPEFLRARAPSLSSRMGRRPVVYVGRTRAGELDVLASIPVGQVREVRFLGPNEARARFGDSATHSAGAIIVMLLGHATPP